MSELNEQFDVLSNTLRQLPESIFRLDYFIREVGEPEEGISNVETACVNVFNALYGLMLALKEKGAAESIYEHDAITTALCIRHVLAHQSGRIKNNLRDAWSRSIPGAPTLIKYNVSDPTTPDAPLYINVCWLQNGISMNKSISKKLLVINRFWKLDSIREQIESSSHGSWGATYICAMSIITEAARKVVMQYGHLIAPAGYDSNVYLEHFKGINAIRPADYGLIT